MSDRLPVSRNGLSRREVLGCAAGLVAGAVTPATYAVVPAGAAATSRTPARTLQDQYANPVIWQDFADIDVIRVDDTYYYSASTMHYSPGAPILRSYDLVNWEFAGHSLPVLDFGSKYDLSGGRGYVAGVWASSLGYRPSNGLFYWVGQIDFARTYIYTAPSVEGPWSRHAEIGNVYYDAGLLVDDDDTMYVAYGATDISVAQLSADASREVRAQQVFSTPSEIGVLEGSRFYKINGNHYIFLTRPANGQYILKSTSGPFGPYEIREILLDLPGPITGGGVPHQGGLVDTPNGDWHYLAFIDAYPGGRVPALAPITWTSDGWPELQLVDGAWGTSYPYPNPPQPVEPLTGVDTFDGTTLKPKWEWNHNPDTTRFSVNNGLTLNTATVTDDLYQARNTVTHRIQGPASTATIELDCSGMADGDRAGLALLRDSSAWIGVRRDGGTSKVVMVDALTMDGDWNTVGTGTEQASADLANNRVWLRCTADIRPGTGRAGRFAYSTDGERFTDLGPEFVMGNDWRFFMGYRFGIFNYATVALGGAVTVVRFELEALQQNEVDVRARPFELGRVQLSDGRFLDNMRRTLEYLRFADVDRLLYNHRMNHGLDTQGAEPCGGWEAPDFPFRTHSQGHFLTAWAQAWALTGEVVFEEKAAYLVAELAKCQANNGAVGFNSGYLSGFPESEFTALEDRTISNGNVPYYAIHKTLAGLLEVWRVMGNEQAGEVLLALAGWVDWRTGRLTYEQMQAMMGTEFGGMNAVLTDLYQQTGDSRWLTAAQRFDHAAVIDPLAAGQDQLNGLHANTQVPKIVGCAREHKATGEQRYLDIAVNFWNIVTEAHTYVIGGNSQAERFREPYAIAAYLAEDTCESCNTYNMLKLTRELFTLEPARVAYADYYENALLNQMLGQQNPADPHGHITYFTPLNPGGRRGVGPAWGGGTWSTDYDSFWCCQGTGLEMHTALMDSIYFHDDAGLYVNLFVPSTLDWTERGVSVEQVTDFPASDTTTLRIAGTPGEWTLRVRIPNWTSDATISVNGEVQDVAAEPGTYAIVQRSWASGDLVEVRLPMSVRLEPTPDNGQVQAVTYGPVVLSGAYKNTDLGGQLPVLAADSITATDTPLTFTATANGSPVTLIPFYDNYQNYTVYWSTT